MINTILNIFTSENEILTKFIISPTVIIEALLIFYLFVTILRIKYTKRKRNIYVFIISISSLITEFFIPSPYNLYVNYIIMFIIIKYLFKEKIIKTLLCIILPTVIFALMGILILKPILIILKLSARQAQYTPIYELFYLFILYISLYILIKIIQNLDIKLILKDDFDKKNKKIILINFALGFFTLCVQLTITAFYTDILPIKITFLSFISLFAYYFINFYSLTKTMKLQVTSKNLESAENYNSTLTYLYDNVKAFKHDFDNMVFIIGGFVNNKDLDGLEKYYKSLEKDCERVNSIALLNPKLINNSGIYNLLISKYKKAHDVNVEIRLEFFFDFNRLHMPIYDFSRILGILLDNSIEAASIADEKQVHILFRDSSFNQTQIISIKNTYINKDIDTSNIFEKGKTSKKNHMGMGLWEVQQILKKHNNIVLNTDHNDKYFTQTLEIYY